MNFETFRGRDVKEALGLVRAAYGNDAIIASTRVVNNGRNGALAHSFVEVKAAPSDSPAPMPLPHKAFPFARANAQKLEAQRDATRDAARDSVRPSHRPPQPGLFSATANRGSALAMPKSASDASQKTGGARSREAREARDAEAKRDAQNDAVESEVRALRLLVTRVLEKKAPKERALMMLNAAGVEGKLATDFTTSLPKTPAEGEASMRDALRERLEKRVVCTQINLEKGQKRLIACVGPTGAGKTTTLAKLAAHASLEKGLDVAIITLDTFRVGAVEQMKRFATLIGVPFAVASDEASLLRALENAPDIVLVDTPSRGPRDEAAMARLAACLDAADASYERDVLLTIPAHARASDAEDLVRAYRKIGLTACVITKLDETTRPGGAVTGAVSAKLPIAFLCKGPRVPEDLENATPGDVARAVLPTHELMT